MLLIVNKVETFQNNHIGKGKALNYNIYSTGIPCTVQGIPVRLNKYINQVVLICGQCRILSSLWTFLGII